MNSDTIVIYKSAYGYTKRYAEWIAENLGCGCSSIDSFDFGHECKTIIFGGALYAGRVNGLKKLVKNLDKIKGKKIVLFTVGLSDPNDPKNLKSIESSVKKQIPPELLSQMKIFHFRGGMDYTKMSFLHSCMMWFMKTMLSKKPASERSDSDNAVIKNFGGSFDFSDKNSINELVEYCL